MARLDDRDQMVEQQLRRRGLTDTVLLRAFRKVPRHAFVTEENELEAYGDRPLPIGLGQTISQPYMVALMTQLLCVRPGTRILEVGTGSGYQAAVLAELGAEVFTIERHASLSERARALLPELGYTGVSFRVGDGSVGWPEHAPYDGIVVTAGGPAVPPGLVEQLADGGRLVMPVGSGSVQNLVRLTRRDRQIHRETFGPCRFVKLIGSNAWKDHRLR